jgi:hypothetical protein
MTSTGIQSIVSAVQQRIDDFFPQRSDSTVMAAAAATAAPAVSQEYISKLTGVGQFRLRTDLLPDQANKCIDLMNKHKALEDGGPMVLLPGALAIFVGAIAGPVFESVYKDDDAIKSNGMTASVLVMVAGLAHGIYKATAEMRLINAFKSQCLERNPSATPVVDIEHATKPTPRPSDAGEGPPKWLPWLLNSSVPQNVYASAQYRSYWRAHDPAKEMSDPVGNALLALPVGAFAFARAGVTAGVEVAEESGKIAVERIVYGLMEAAF